MYCIKRVVFVGFLLHELKYLTVDLNREIFFMPLESDRSILISCDSSHFNCVVMNGTVMADSPQLIPMLVVFLFLLGDFMLGINKWTGRLLR